MSTCLCVVSNNLPRLLRYVLYERIMCTREFLLGFVTRRFNRWHISVFNQLGQPFILFIHIIAIKLIMPWILDFVATAAFKSTLTMSLEMFAFDIPTSQGHLLSGRRLHVLKCSYLPAGLCNRRRYKQYPADSGSRPNLRACRGQFAEPRSGLVLARQLP